MDMGPMLYAAVCAAILFAPLAWAVPEEKDFTPESIAECRAKAEAGNAEGQTLYAYALLNGWGM